MTATVQLGNSVTLREVAKRADEHEQGCMVVEARNTGASGKTWRYHAKGSRIVVFDWDPRRRCFAFRCPMTVWEARDGELPKSIFESPTLIRSSIMLVPRVEAWDPERAKDPTVSRKGGDFTPPAIQREIRGPVLGGMPRGKPSREPKPEPGEQIREELEELQPVGN